MRFSRPLDNPGSQRCQYLPLPFWYQIRDSYDTTSTAGYDDCFPLKRCAWLRWRVVATMAQVGGGDLAVRSLELYHFTFIAHFTFLVFFSLTRNIA